MANASSQSRAGSRDGTSQADRRQATLDPDYVQVDERSLQDLLRFAHKYARELKYFNERNLPDENWKDWSRFIGTESDGTEPDDIERYLEQAAAYADDPTSFEGNNGDTYRRPHFALLLSYLGLLRHAQNGLNTITKRHLDFYYQQVLRMTKQSAVPDRVNVLLRPAPRTPEVDVPDGSLLDAGKDSLGRDRFYRTDRRILVNRAKLARLSAVYAERQVTGIRDARETFEGPRDQAVEVMFRVALGDPLPGDPLPDYGSEPLIIKIDYATLRIKAALVDQAGTVLFMEMFELRELMKLKRRRDEADDEWSQINEKLEIVGRARSGDPNFELQPDDPRDFDANLATALDAEPDFAGLPQVENIDDLYDQRVRTDVKEFIRDQLYFERFEDFVEMMQIKDVIDNEWSAINRILELAGQRKQGDPSYELPPAGSPGFDPTDFEANVDDAIGPVDVETDFNQYYAELLKLEAYFFMSAENFAYVMAVADKYVDPVANEQDPAATDAEWGKVYDILAQAHRTKVFTRRRNALKNVREAGDDAPAGFKAVLHFVLGEHPEQGAANPLERLRDYVATETDYQFLETEQDRLQQNAGAQIDWGQVYRVLEIAQRIRDRLPEPVAQIKEWVNLHAHPDVTTASVAEDEDNPRWKTFGGRATDTDADNPPAENIGWAISSPLLNLSAGTRRILLTLGFGEDDYDGAKIEPLFAAGPVSSADYAGPFRIEISTEKGWIQPDSIEAKHGDYQQLSAVGGESKQAVPALQLILRFSEQADPIVAPAGEDVLAGSPWPVIRLMLRQRWDAQKERFTTDYPPFEHLRLLYVHVRVEVGGPEAGGGAGLSEFLIQNDQAALDPKKPFEPFGSSPAVGSRFYIGHTELMQKRLDRLRFRIEWMGVPGDLAAHYANYPTTTNNGTWPFKTRVQLVDKGLGLTLGGSEDLFAATDATKTHSIAIDDVPASLQVADSEYRYERTLEPFQGQNLLDWPRYLQWELTPLDFQHQSYPAVAARKAVEMASALAKNPESPVTAYLINPPYTPKIKQLGIAYGASLEIDLSAYRPGAGPDRILHLNPFGYNEAQPESPGAGFRFLPNYDAEGELYLGISDANPPQVLSVLFQMAEGSANPDLEPVPVVWSYLSGDRWTSLADGGVRLDSTRGLINTGIIEFELRPAEPSTRLPAGYYWIRGAIARNSDSVCDAIALHAQAVSATFIDNDNASDHYAQPLPEKTITGLSPRLPAIAEVIQPYTSFGGKPQEQDQIFYTRVSERLRHKQRALGAWDYERLVLDRFPQIYKAKCIPSEISQNPDDAGRLWMVVIPDVRDRLPFDPFEPKVPADLLADVEAYLADKTPPYVRVNVGNAHYVPVKVRVGVRFKPGYDQGFYIQKLNDDLNRFLSPWAYEEGADIAIGSRIYANSIVNFLDQRDYVDYLAEIKLFSSEDNGRTFVLAQPTEADGYFVTTGKVNGVLVAARRHEVDVLTEEAYDEEVFTGINYMKIELDFVVGPDAGSEDLE